MVLDDKDQKIYQSLIEWFGSASDKSNMVNNQDYESFASEVMEFMYDKLQAKLIQIDDRVLEHLRDKLEKKLEHALLIDELCNDLHSLIFIVSIENDIKNNTDNAEQYKDLIRGILLNFKE